MDALLYQYNPWWESARPPSGLYLRERYLGYLQRHLSSKRALLVTGLRRAGKTTLLRLLAWRLVEHGVPAETILYVSVDDYLLRGNSLFDIVEAYRKVHRLSVDREVTLLFDEVTSQHEFQQQLKTLVDREHCRVVASSSSSSLLKDQRGLLTGRSLTIEVQPLSFAEYLDFSNIHIARRDRRLLESYFRDYVRSGGLPEHVRSPDREYLMSLVDDIIQKDITAFHGLRDHQLLRDYFTLLMERSGKQVSINKIAKILRLSPDTARRYLGYFEESYLIHPVPRWGKTNERLLSPRKMYACDLGIKQLFIGDRDWGSYFENYVYLQLRAWGKMIWYVYEDGNEIDFLTDDRMLVEAKYYDEMSQAQRHLFERFDARRKVIIDSVEALSQLAEEHGST